MDFTEKEMKEYLEDAYWKESKTLMQIGQELGMTPSGVFIMFEKYNIKTRKVSKAIKLWWKKRKSRELA